MSVADVLEAVLLQTDEAQLAKPSPIISRHAALEARIADDDDQTVTPPLVGDDT